MVPLSFSGAQHDCGGCFCHYDIQSDENIFTCSNPSLTKLPTAPQLTNTILLMNTKVKYISQNAIAAMKPIQSLRKINMSNNLIERVSNQIQYLKQVEEIWLGGNPIKCESEMIWMIPWLNTVHNITRKLIVKDFDEVKCSNGRFRGLPIHLLTVIKQGCYPHKLTAGQTAGVSVAGAFFVLVFCITVIVLKNPREVKFYMYYYLRLNTVPKDDKNEDVTNMEYDAFLCFWYENYISP